MNDYVGDPVRVHALLERLMNRNGFGVTISRDKRSEGGKFSVEFCYHADGGSDYEGGFANVAAALNHAADKADRYDEAEGR